MNNPLFQCGRDGHSAAPARRFVMLMIVLPLLTGGNRAQQDPASPPGPPVFNPALLRSDTVKYTQTMNMMGREVTVNTTRTVAPARRGPARLWRVIDRIVSPMGEGADTLDLDASTLMPVRRAGRQGPGSVALTFSPGGVRGSISSGAMTVPVDVKFPALTLPDGAGIEVPLATLPLREGYRASLGVYDIMAGKSRPMVLAVTGTGNVAAAGTTIDAWKVELTSPDDPSSDETYWIAKTDRRLVKSEAKLPASMGGGTVVSEMVGR